MESCRACHAGKLYVCEYCGTLNKTSYCNCEEARNERDGKIDQLNYERAEKLTPEQYDGWIYREGYGYEEGYFKDVETLEEYCEENNIELPAWVYCCELIDCKLNIDLAIEDMLEDSFEDARNRLKDENELYDFIEKWNAKQNIANIYPDRTRVVVFKKGVLE